MIPLEVSCWSKVLRLSFHYMWLMVSTTCNAAMSGGCSRCLSADTLTDKVVTVEEADMSMRARTCHSWCARRDDETVAPGRYRMPQTRRRRGWTDRYDAAPGSASQSQHLQQTVQQFKTNKSAQCWHDMQPSTLAIHTCTLHCTILILHLTCFLSQAENWHIGYSSTGERSRQFFSSQRSVQDRRMNRLKMQLIRMAT